MGRERESAECTLSHLVETRQWKKGFMRVKKTRTLNLCPELRKPNYEVSEGKAPLVQSVATELLRVF